MSDHSIDSQGDVRAGGAGRPARARHPRDGSSGQNLLVEDRRAASSAHSPGSVGPEGPACPSKRDSVRSRTAP
ncbi:hypothetical protein FRIGORI9N_40047 [Frigoribacterium sp. 9N]|nr:hypothetical protein FRIGORI9N_40047 [Frigoribacterium sp. 9N]